MKAKPTPLTEPVAHWYTGAPHHWLDVGRVLTAWNASHARPEALRGYVCVSVRAARRACHRTANGL